MAAERNASVTLLNQARPKKKAKGNAGRARPYRKRKKAAAESSALPSPEHPIPLDVPAPDVENSVFPLQAVANELGTTSDLPTARPPTVRLRTLTLSRYRVAPPRSSPITVRITLAHHHLTPADRYLWTLPMFSPRHCADCDAAARKAGEIASIIEPAQDKRTKQM